MPVLTRTVYIKVKEFAEKYALGTTRAYEIVNMENFPKIKTGPKGIRVKRDEADEFMQKQFNY